MFRRTPEQERGKKQHAWFITHGSFFVFHIRVIGLPSGIHDISVGAWYYPVGRTEIEDWLNDPFPSFSLLRITSNAVSMVNTMVKRCTVVVGKWDEHSLKNQFIYPVPD